MSGSEGFVYLDTSVALAHLLSETETPPASLWTESLVASRLLEHEMATRLRALGLEFSHGPLARELLSRVALLELVGPVVSAPDASLPANLRTLDALHLGSMRFLREQGARVRLASYDRRLLAAAESSGFEAYPL